MVTSSKLTISARWRVMSSAAPTAIIAAVSIKEVGLTMGSIVYPPMHLFHIISANNVATMSA